MDKKLEKDIADGKVVLGGCEYEPRFPDLHCNDCEYEFSNGRGGAKNMKKFWRKRWVQVPKYWKYSIWVIHTKWVFVVVKLDQDLFFVKYGIYRDNLAHLSYNNI